MVGTARLVIGRREASGRAAGLPMLQYCPDERLRDLPIETTAEISRFALSKTRRQEGGASDQLLRYALMRGILGVSLQLRLSHWCAIMEPSLFRLLRLAGIAFRPLGPAVECSGLRQPCAATIPAVLSDGAARQPDLYRFVAASPMHELRSAA